MDTPSLLCTTLRVIPLPAHGHYWEMGFGYLRIWLRDSDPHNACRRARTIAQELPFEIVGSRAQVLDYSKENADYHVRSKLVASVGASLMLVAVRTGADEDNFRS